MEIIASEVLPNDFNALVSELKIRASGRPIQIVSDFDETLCSRYVFSEKWQNHVPHIQRDLVKEAKLLSRPICIATARTSTEPVSWVAWHELSRIPMPLVAENGAVLVWPPPRVTMPARLQILATDDQVQIIKMIREEFETGLINDLKVPVGHEVVLRPGRVASVELRAQEENTKIGMPEDYAALSEQLLELFSQHLSLINVVSSGSSLGIQPRGIGKDLGIQAALKLASVDLNDVFLLGVGDNLNDKALFDFVKQKGGLTVGVRPTTKGLCDFTIDGGDLISLKLVKSINQLEQ